jgi:hypothetical protein
MIDGMTKEVESSDGDETKLFENLKKFRPLLHPNHHVLSDIRRQLIPTFCRGGRKKLDDFPDEKFRQKLLVSTI